MIANYIILALCFIGGVAVRMFIDNMHTNKTKSLEAFCLAAVCIVTSILMILMSLK